MYLVALLVVGIHYEPIATAIFGIVFAVGAAVLCLQIYFMPLKTKLEGTAKAKARYGIPLDEPHRVDKILKSGFFRIP